MCKKKYDIAIVMGSQSDFPILEKAGSVLEEFGLDYEFLIVSAHRTPDRLYSFARNAQSNGIRIIIAGAGGSAHLPGMLASISALPVIAVPMKSRFLDGLDSLLSIVQMPSGVPVASMSIGESGAINAALFAVSVLSLSDHDLSIKLHNWRIKQSVSVQEVPEV